MTDCLERTPFGSLIALILITPTLGVWAYTMYIGLPIAVEQIGKDLLSFDVRWLEQVRIGVIVTAVMMFLICLLFTIFGFLATGATRKAVYSQEACVLGGRATAGFLIVVCFCCFIFWLWLLVFHTAPTIGGMMASGFCAQNALYSEHSRPDCFRFQLINYGIRFNETLLQEQTERYVKTEIVDKFRIDALCQKATQAATYFYVAEGCAFIIVIALLIFLATLVANSNRIGLTREVAEYRDAFEQQEYEMNSMGSRKIYYG